MKKFKKILALALAAVMLLAMSTTAFATDADPTAATTGSITVKNATKGQEYKAYKVFDATYDGDNVSYKTPATNASKLDNTLFGWSAADAAGNISVWALDTATEQNILTWVKNNYAQFGGTAISGTFDEANSTVTFKNLDFGYYYITSTLGSAVTIDSAVPTATVYDKNATSPEAPAKTIVAVDGVAVNALTADAHVGSIVDFKITAKTNNWIDKDTIRPEWKVTDTPTNMEFDLSTLVVKFNGTPLTKDTDYTVTTDTSTGAFTINVTMVDSNGNSVFEATPANNGLIPIEITYSATITKDAGKNPAKNQIPGSDIEVFTYAFQVAKTDGKDPLKGAQFELWANNAALTFIDNGDGTYTYYAKTGDDDTTTVVTTLDMTTNTTISLLGLDKDWAYTLKEITVPSGYNKIADVTVTGPLTKVTKGMDTSITSTALYRETVVNQKGVELPSTGGMGTTILYIVGGVVVAAALVLLITKRRMRREEY